MEYTFVTRGETLKLVGRTCEAAMGKRSAIINGNLGQPRYATWVGRNTSFEEETLLRINMAGGEEAQEYPGDFR